MPLSIAYQSLSLFEKLLHLAPAGKRFPPIRPGPRRLLVGGSAARRPAWRSRPIASHWTGLLFDAMSLAP